MDNAKKVLVVVDSTLLREDGFTEQGADNCLTTIIQYADSLKDQATRLARSQIDGSSDIEITRDHVRTAAHWMAESFGRRKPSNWRYVQILVLRVIEILASFAVGVGGSYWESWGRPVAIGGAVVLVIAAAFEITSHGVDQR